MSIRSLALQRTKFDLLYDMSIVGTGFFESDDYYRFDKERYWRSLQAFSNLPISIASTNAGSRRRSNGGSLQEPFWRRLCCRRYFG